MVSFVKGVKIHLYPCVKEMDTEGAASRWSGAKILQYNPVKYQIIERWLSTILESGY